MLLKNSYKNEFNQIEGTTLFPYFNKEITVIYEEGISPEYVKKCLKYLEAVDETLMLQICKYAEFFLKDKLKNTSIGEVYSFPYHNLLDLLQYFSFETMYIEEPPESVADSYEINVLNLSGGCDWWEDEGLQCLIKNGEVTYLGYYGALSVWNDYSEDCYGNYAIYERWDELRKKAAEVHKLTDMDLWKVERMAGWRAQNLPVIKLERFVDGMVSARENVDIKEATEIFENSYLFELMNEYPKLLEESSEFWYECYCIEKEKDIGELVRYISENCEWNLF